MPESYPVPDPQSTDLVPSLSDRLTRLATDTSALAHDLASNGIGDDDAKTASFLHAVAGVLQGRDPIAIDDAWRCMVAVSKRTAARYRGESTEVPS